jgi:biotin carboxylase
MQRVLLFAATTGYQTRAFGEAAEQLDVELVFATDRCHVIDDPWRDGAIAIRFYDEDASVAAVLEAAKARPIDGVLAVGDRPTVIAARAAEALGLAWHSVDAAAAARHKLRTRERLRAAGLPVPLFCPFAIDDQPSALSRQPPSFPCVIKPVALSGSRGVMRADDPGSFATAVTRLRALMRSPEVRAERDEAHDTAIVEAFIPGHEYAVDAILHHGELHVLAIFDKPDPLDGPFFEETIYVTPPNAPAPVVDAITTTIARACAALGLRHGPIHAECRVGTHSSHPQVFVLEVAARPIGGLCAQALRFERATDSAAADATQIPLEQLLLRHALGESPAGWRREAAASGVMMIPIPRRGMLRRVDGIDAARAVPHIVGVRITAKDDQRLVPLPEGASYLGFIFARADRAADVDRALREAHRCLQFTIDPEFAVLASPQVHYNQDHG